MERTALAGMRRCLRTGKALRCTTHAPKCIAMAICPARSVANTSAGISMSANPLPTPPKKTTTLRTNPLSRREYSSSSSSSSPIEGTIGQGAAGIPADKIALTAPSHLDAAEKDIFDVLNRELEPDKLEVKDVSGGCGSMYAIEVTSERFRGLGMLKQQRLVNGVLGERVKGWHGVQMKTGVP